VGTDCLDLLKIGIRWLENGFRRDFTTAANTRMNIKELSKSYCSVIMERYLTKKLDYDLGHTLERRNFHKALQMQGEFSHINNKMIVTKKYDY
jgi:hypothetical protein